MGDVWFWSDLHLGHRRVAEHRGYNTPGEHDIALVQAWHECVGENDQVWLLGDIAASSPTYALAIIDGLPGEKHLIWGNHDKGHPMYRDAHKQAGKYLNVFASAQPFARRKISGQDVLLSHFPYEFDHTPEPRFMQYRLINQGKWLLHGHIHSNTVTTSNREIHVGVDAWKKPVHLREIQELIEERMIVEETLVIP